MSQDVVNGHGDAWEAGQQFWNSTVPNWSHSAKDWWKSPRVTMTRIEVLVSLVSGVLLLLAIFGSRRRRSRNWFLQKSVFVAYTLSFSLATYILGSMQSSGVKSSMYPIWVISLIMLHGCTDSITAFSLDDNKQQTRLAYQAYMYIAYTVLLLMTVGTVYSLPLLYIALLACVRYAQRLAVCGLAGYSWNLNKTVADYMYDENNKGAFVTMEDCSYLVDWPLHKLKFDALTYATQLKVEDTDEVINIGKIWGKSLGPELKDASLSFSLFHLLRRRFFGFACDESKGRARDFVFKGLLSAGATDYKRVFKVIDVELAFLYDFFFTKYAVIYYGSMAATIWSLISAIGISITAYITMGTPVKISRGDSIVITTTTYDIVITLVILASTALLEFIQLLLYWTGIWGRVSFVCQSIREEARLNRSKTSTVGSCFVMGLKGFLANIGVRFAPNEHYWQHKLGQYSLLDSISYNPITDMSHKWRKYILLVMRVVYLLDILFIHPENAEALRVRKKARKYVELPGEVKEALICSLKCTLERTGDTLCNGKSSLQSNGVQEQLSWACKPMEPSWSQRNQNQTHIILTWHIATCYCEMAHLSDGAAEFNTLSPDGAAELKKHFSIATHLSKYCAYLMISAPKLLPGHHYDTVRKFDAAAVEAITFLEKATNKYQDMKSLLVPEETETIFKSGVKLGKQLMEVVKGSGTRWKVMADFWAEMMLYLAPSDNVEEHIEQLAQGGEFITHLWALLSHAGILEREQEHQAGDV